jgi:hypothetical protein
MEYIHETVANCYHLDSLEACPLLKNHCVQPSESAGSLAQGPLNKLRAFSSGALLLGLSSLLRGRDSEFNTTEGVRH